MKKIFFCFISLILVLVININASAKEELIPAVSDSDYENISKLKEGIFFNCFELKINEETLKVLNYYNHSFSDDVLLGNVNIKNDISFYSENGDLIETKEMVTNYRVSKGKISRITSKIGDDTIIDSKILDNEVIPNPNYYFDLNEYNDSYNLAMISNISVTALGSEASFELDLFLALTYTELDGEDYYIDGSNLSNLEIANIIGISDNDKNKILNISVIDYEFIDDLNYSIKIRGFNKKNMALIKKINIHIIDISEYINIKDFNVSYNEYLSKDIILNNIVIKNYESYTLKSDYYNSYKTIGNYNYYIKINIDDKNILAKGLINVKDEIKPYLKLETKIIKANKISYLTKEDILNHFIIYDEYDGIIDGNNITLDGYLDYLVGYMEDGDFNIKLIAKDSSLNDLEYEFYINVGDNLLSDIILEYEINKNEEIIIKPDTDETIIENIDIINPKVLNSDYVIFAYTNQKLTSSDIQDLLISEGYLNESDIVSINSDYFFESNLEPGSYPLEVKYQNGDITYYEIKLENKEVIESTKENNSNFIAFIVIGVITLIGIVLIIIMRVYVYGKKN